VKKLAILNQIMGLFLFACSAHAAEMSSVNVRFIITNNNKTGIVKYELFDPRGLSHKGTLYPNSSLLTTSYDTAVINFDTPDESLFGVYMLHYRSADWFWNNNVFANDVVVTVQQNSNVLCTIANEGVDSKITVLDQSGKTISEIPAGL